MVQGTLFHNFPKKTIQIPLEVPSIALVLGYKTVKGGDGDVPCVLFPNMVLFQLKKLQGLRGHE